VRVDLTEAALVGALARERLHHAHSADVLGEGRGDEAQALADRAVGARRSDPEERSRDRHEW
jgi:hypothetical protein